MNQIEWNFMDVLQRENFAFQNGEVKTECVKDHGGYTILGKKIGPFEKGKEYKLRFFIAVPFIKNNILKVAAGDKCDNLDVQRYAISERDDQKLVRRERPFFLNTIKEFKSFTKKEIEAGIRPSLDMDRYNSYLINILDSRLLKLLKLTKTPISPDNERRLTNSEKILFGKVFSLINAWRSFFLS